MVRLNGESRVAVRRLRSTPHRRIRDPSPLGPRSLSRYHRTPEVEKPARYVQCGAHCTQYPHRFHDRSRREMRSEEHTSELQSRLHLVCRLLLEKKKKKERKRSTCTL